MTSNAALAGGAPEDPLDFLASENNVLRAGKLANELRDKEEQEGMFHHRAIVSPQHALVALLLGSRWGRVFAVMVTLGALLVLLLDKLGILGGR